MKLLKANKDEDKIKCGRAREDEIKEFLEYASGAACVAAIGTTTTLNNPIEKEVLQGTKNSFIKYIIVESRKPF